MPSATDTAMAPATVTAVAATSSQSAGRSGCGRATVRATPVDSVRAEVRASPDARLVVIKGAGHVTTAMSARARAEVRRFLLR